MGGLACTAAVAQTTRPTSPDAPDGSGTSSWEPWTVARLTGDWGGVRPDLEDLGFKLDLSYQQQYQQNFRGGLETDNGHRFSGSYDLVFKLDFEKMELLENAGFYFKTKGHWSDGINPDKVGASSAADPNSDAFDDHALFVKKWWYWQKFLEDRIELRLGVLETNKDLFDIGMYANHEDKDFQNKLSIRNATVPHKTGMGAFLKIEPVEGLYLQAAGVDAQAKARHTQFDTAFHDEAWYIGLWELGVEPEWKTSRGRLPGRYRVGWWYDSRVSQIYRDDRDGRRHPDYRGDDVGFYIGLDQMVWKERDDAEDRQGLGVYARYGHAHRDINKISDYWSAGLSYRGLIPTRDKDVAAFGVSQAIYSTQYRHETHPGADRETVYEWYYQIQLTPWCTIAPDFQVITNPGGDIDDRDAIVGGVRIRILF